MPKEPVCIRRCGTVEEASIIVGWLKDQGVEARIVDPANPGVMAFGVTDPEGIEIYVADEAAADRAADLLDTHDQTRAAELVSSGEIVEVVCDKCGSTNTFSPEDRGTVQECHDCGEYVDIPEASAKS